MPIYTKTGDQGMTSLFDGTRVKKASLRVEVYGTFDECCAQISLAQKRKIFINWKSGSMKKQQNYQKSMNLFCLEKV